MATIVRSYDFHPLVATDAYVRISMYMTATRSFMGCGDSTRVPRPGRPSRAFTEYTHHRGVRTALQRRCQFSPHLRLKARSTWLASRPPAPTADRAR
jgi:hypothetical protein